MTMLIFSRRALQKRLDSLNAVLTRDVHQRLIARLERPGRDRFAAMWETVMLSALHSVTPVRHEEPHLDGSRPDFALTYIQGAMSFEIVGDITTASDKGLHEKNPVGHFWNEIIRLARKYRLNPNHFSFQIKGKSKGRFGDSHMVLLLPPRNQLAALIKRHVEPFIRRVARNPVPKASMPYAEADAEFTLTYDQAQMFGGGGHPVYNIAQSLTKTPIYTALAKKADQLRHAAPDKLRVVILCDAGCEAMRSQCLSGSGRSYSAAEIVTEFLRKTTAVDIVLLVAVEEINPFSDRRLRLGLDFAVSPRQSRESRVTPEAVVAFKALVEAMLPTLPTPMLNARNAALRCEVRGYGLGFHGGLSMSGKKIRISSRELLELLAGSISTIEFDRSHGWDAASSAHRPPNPFSMALARGDMIDVINVIDGHDHDDDWLEICLRDRDPAISPFKPKG